MEGLGGTRPSRGQTITVPWTGIRAPCRRGIVCPVHHGVCNAPTTEDSPRLQGQTAQRHRLIEPTLHRCQGKTSVRQGQTSAHPVVGALYAPFTTARTTRRLQRASREPIQSKIDMIAQLAANGRVGPGDASSYSDSWILYSDFSLAHI